MPCLFLSTLNLFTSTTERVYSLHGQRRRTCQRCGYSKESLWAWSIQKRLHCLDVWVAKKKLNEISGDPSSTQTKVDRVWILGLEKYNMQKLWIFFFVKHRVLTTRCMRVAKGQTYVSTLRCMYGPELGTEEPEWINNERGSRAVVSYDFTPNAY